ncbi:MAG: hypothetical protein Q8K05_13380 [Polaromonas sp.]|uniref:hypothetical protein n=1 Tax=Polaromonas sp. TaxID=1869339 RepID=UPI002730DDED|nr:hypothetical protein [Polaromonas sp.]MDP2257026.1 hypothetical protein [Polaromonas sp.]
MNPASPIGRPLRPLPELRDTVSNVSNGLDALCELLHLAGESKVFAVSVLELLKPLCDQLTTASCDLNDMRM